MEDGWRENGLVVCLSCMHEEGGIVCVKTAGCHVYFMYSICMNTSWGQVATS